MRPYGLEVHRPHPNGLTARLVGIGTRGVVRFAHWRGRRDAERDLRRGLDPSFRGFIQINLIRTR